MSDIHPGLEILRHYIPSATARREFISDCLHVYLEREGNKMYLSHPVLNLVQNHEKYLQFFWPKRYHTYSAQENQEIVGHIMKIGDFVGTL